MLKNVTFSASEELIRRARLRARQQNTTLNAEFRRWLEKYACGVQSAEEFEALTKRLAHVQAGRKFSREEMNARQILP